MSSKNYTKQSTSNLAKAICAGSPLNLASFGLTYRKGKTVSDILAARTKAINSDKDTEATLKNSLVDILKRG